jgi:hypothetical protein
MVYPFMNEETNKPETHYIHLPRRASPVVNTYKELIVALHKLELLPEIKDYLKDGYKSVSLYECMAKLNSETLLTQEEFNNKYKIIKVLIDRLKMEFHDEITKFVGFPRYKEAEAPMEALCDQF